MCKIAARSYNITGCDRFRRKTRAQPALFIARNVQNISIFAIPAFSHTHMSPTHTYTKQLSRKNLKRSLIKNPDMRSRRFEILCFL